MDADRCVSCGDIIPEGRQICWKCEYFYLLSSVRKYRLNRFIRLINVLKCIGYIFIYNPNTRC